MNTLDLIRNTTVEKLEGVRSDFDDLSAPVYRPKNSSKGMVRIVEGADDLKRPTPSVPSGFGSTPAPVRDEIKDGRSPRQAELMKGLLEQLQELDQDTFSQALEYTAGMTVRGLWTPGAQGNASRWIGNMIAKVRELRNAAKKTTTPNDDAKFQDIPNGYYAINDSGAPDDIHYFRISRFRDGGIKVQEQASDTLHPVRRGGRRTAVLTAIQTVGWRTAQELYGQTIGRCGRCNRTLTDSESRARGIGPDCWGKM